jgi:hypothetical protein
MADPLGDQELADIEARCKELAALAALLRRTGPAGSPHVSPAAVAGWFDDLCGRDLPRLAVEIRRLREELAYLRTLQAQSDGSQDARLRAALQQIAGTTWKAWFAEEAAQEMVRQARWALGYEGPEPLDPPPAPPDPR